MLGQDTSCRDSGARRRRDELVIEVRLIASCGDIGIIEGVPRVDELSGVVVGDTCSEGESLSIVELTLVDVGDRTTSWN